MDLPKEFEHNLKLKVSCFLIEELWWWSIYWHNHFAVRVVSLIMKLWSVHACMYPWETSIWLFSLNVNCTYKIFPNHCPAYFSVILSPKEYLPSKFFFSVSVLHRFLTFLSLVPLKAIRGKLCNLTTHCGIKFTWRHIVQDLLSYAWARKSAQLASE